MPDGADDLPACTEWCIAWDPATEAQVGTAHGLNRLAWLCRALECTGTLIGTRHVLTAGHCVYDIHTTHKMVSSLDFAPGMNGHGRPNGVVQWQNVRILSQFQSQVGSAAHILPSARPESTTCCVPAHPCISSTQA